MLMPSGGFDDRPRGHESFGEYRVASALGCFWALSGIRTMPEYYTVQVCSEPFCCTLFVVSDGSAAGGRSRQRETLRLCSEK